jgi:septum formation protein
VADTSVLCDDEILGKPRDEEHAARMFGALSGRTHAVVTRFAVAREARVLASSVRTEVEFRAVSADEIAAYIATGEGVDKAGGYAIQGVGAMFVRRIVGSYTNVVGLPLCEVVEAIRSVDG